MHPSLQRLIPKRTWLPAVRLVLLALVLIASGYLILTTVQEHYPVREWLFWRYAAYWLTCGVFSAACLSAGHRMVSVLLPQRAPPAEHLVTSMALGVFVFFAGMFLAGLLGAFGTWWAIGWPLVMIASGAVPLTRYLRRLRRHVRAVRPHHRVSIARNAALAFGLLGVAIVYFVILTPDNVGYDAQWYHLPIAEHYAAQGSIRAFPEGWFPGTGPHLASILYTWAFLLPGTVVFDRVLMCAHLEFTLFLWTLASIPPLVRRLLHGRRVPHAWTALFLFPGVMLYDASLCVGADHVAAFWAAPIFLALLRAWERPSPRVAVPLALFISGAALTKYTAFMLVILPVMAMVGRSVWVAARQTLSRGGVRSYARDAALGLGVFAVLGLAATTPHWLKNWVWYGDPVYPILQARLGGHPWTPDSAAFYQHAITDTLFRPKGALSDELLQTIKVLFTFGFEPHNWPHFHGSVPVFGFLFTTGSACILFFRRTGRVWGVVLAVWVGIASWYWFHAQDRYLQAALPWMVAVAAAAIVLAWHAHASSRVLMAGLVALQIVWGGDVTFLRTHTMLHDSPVKASVNLLASGFEKKYDKRLEVFWAWQRVGAALPPDAKVVVHEEHTHLGLMRMSVNDWPGIQGGLSYGRFASPRAMHEQMLAWGVTHFAYFTNRSRAIDSLAGDLLFFGYVTRYGQPVKVDGGVSVVAVPASAPPDVRDERVAYLGCGTTYRAGLYRRADMVVMGAGRHAKKEYPEPLQPMGGDASVEDLVAASDYVVWTKKCHPSLTADALRGFVRVATRKKQELWVRKP